MDDPGMLVGELIRLATPVGQVLARELGLSLTDLSALHHLVGRAPIGPAELGKRLGMSSASATVLVDRLERAGYVRREPDPADRRRIVLVVAEQTAARSLTAIRPLADAVAAVTTRLNDEQRNVVAGYLSEVARAMNEFVRPRRAGADSVRPGPEGRMLR